MAFEEGEVVLCTVDKIEKTIVFVDIDSEQGKKGSIVLSEIAPGRIRNLREYVVPKKKIVCKILRIDNAGNLNLSLRRVNQRERQEILEKEKQEKSCRSILKTVLGKDSEKIIQQICKNEPLSEFLEKTKGDSKELEKLVGKENAKKIIEIISKQKKKKSEVKKQISLTTKEPNGIELIKKILENKPKELEISYISAGKYSVKTEAENLKEADKKIENFLKELESNAKKMKIDFARK